jgi:predicted AAA+ superfamily ATPase
VERSLRDFPVTMLLGMRQVGKTTLAHAVDGRTYVTLDDLGALAAARRDPEDFVAGLPSPVTIDEVQRAPDLLLAIKRIVDRRRRAGEFLLTGSAQIELKRGIRETLAGRAAVMHLRPMTWAEMEGAATFNGVDVLFGCRSTAEVARRLGREAPFDAARILVGGLPVPALDRQSGRRARWLEQYQLAYLQHDVPPFVRVEEVAAFFRFLQLAASRTAQLANYSALARDAGVSADTGLRWFGVLQATFLIDSVPPYFRNLGKRLVRSPKLHLGDVGVAAHLMGLRTWSEAVRQGHAGALVETLVAQHLLAWCDASSRPTQLFHYRSHAGAEVDFVLSRGPRLVPVEVKMGSSPTPSDLRGLKAFLDDIGETAPFGVVLCSAPQCSPLGRRIVGVPIGAFLGGGKVDRGRARGGEVEEERIGQNRKP